MSLFCRPTRLVSSLSGNRPFVRSSRRSASSQRGSHAQWQAVWIALRDLARVNLMSSLGRRSSVGGVFPLRRFPSLQGVVSGLGAPWMPPPWRGRLNRSSCLCAASLRAQKRSAARSLTSLAPSPASLVCRVTSSPTTTSGPNCSGFRRAPCGPRPPRARALRRA